MNISYRIGGLAAMQGEGAAAKNCRAVQGKFTRPDGRAFRYFPKIPREQCVRRESESFLQRVFGGAVAPMLAHFCETTDLSDEEVARLRKILNRKGKARDE